MEYLAHIDGLSNRTQSVSEHLASVAELAAGFGAEFSSAEAARRCGLLHDIGKFSAAFQRRITGDNIFVDHSTAGAVEAFRLGDVAAAFCVAGHHGGIPDRGSRRFDCADDPTLMGRIKRRAGIEIEDYSAFKQQIALPARADSLANGFGSSTESAFFYAHMLYSCLVDADWLDSESFMSGGAVERGTGLPLARLCELLESYVKKWDGAVEELNLRRAEILGSLTEAARRESGLFTLTVPTGGGKTVSSMAFALRHALKHGKRRAIYVIPYTSIIEQTQSVFEEIFGAESVVAHYADVSYAADENGGLSPADARRRLASENWDAPIILTTAVQFFESLYSNRPSRCRKLHNIANSVIIFDEAQMLPANNLRPCILAIAELVKNYRCTCVLCTATQPSLGALIERYLPDGASELCRGVAENHEAFKRVSYRFEGALANEELARRLAAERQVLCVVNSRRQAQELFRMLPGEGCFHLSTAMTASHRRRVLAEVRERLAAGEECRVVSTSLIEAGVDVDFPAVWRAVAGLDSLIQAAGRCNREGRRPAAESVVHIFDTDTKAPPSLRQNIEAARGVIERYDDISSPEAVAAYFDLLLYILKGEKALDEKNILGLINKEMAFERVAKEFRIIDSDTVAIYVPLDGGEPLVQQLVKGGPNRKLLRELGPYSVSVYKNDYIKLRDAGAVSAVSENAAILLDISLYGENTGLALSIDSDGRFIV